MIPGLFGLVKYPSAAGIIGLIWIGSAILIIYDTNLPLIPMIAVNMVVSIIIGYIGFRVEK